MNTTRYDFSCGVAAFFEIATEDARRLLPARFSPLEVHYGRSVLVVNLYDFTHSEVGPYQEIVYGIMTLPRIVDGVVPNGAVYPWQVATSTEAARLHASERWHLPHWPEDVRIELREEGDRVIAETWPGGELAARLEVKAGKTWNRDPLLFQSFMLDERGAFSATVRYDGEVSEHEEGTARLTLTPDHPFNAGLGHADVDPCAFREIWQRGFQTFQPLEPLP